MDSDESSNGEGWRTQIRNGWIPGQMCAEKILADAVTIDGRREWSCKSCSETNVWTRWRCCWCHTNIPSGLQRKYGQAVSAKAGVYSSGSSSSSGGEKKRSRDAVAEIRELREELKRCKHSEKRQGTQYETAGGESGHDEVWKMDQRKKELQQQLREIERFTDVPKGTQQFLKEQW